jgi:hypothetical protein
MHWRFNYTHCWSLLDPGRRSMSCLEGPGLAFKFEFNVWFLLLTTLLLHWFLLNVRYIFSKHGPSIHTHPYTLLSLGQGHSHFWRVLNLALRFVSNVWFSLCTITSLIDFDSLTLHCLDPGTRLMSFVLCIICFSICIHIYIYIYIYIYIWL